MADFLIFISNPSSMPDNTASFPAARPPLNTQADAVVHFIHQLDVDMVSDLLEEKLTYEDLPKAVFIQKLREAFDEFLDAGNNRLIGYTGVCNDKHCNIGCSGYSFVGNHSGHYFDLIIEMEEGQVKDIYECTRFRAYHQDREKGEQVIIDKSRYGNRGWDTAS